MELQRATRPLLQSRAGHACSAKIVVLVVIAVWPISLFAADNQAQQNPREVSAALAVHSQEPLDSLIPIFDAADPQSFDKGFVLHSRPRRLESSNPEKSVCYTMRTYLMEREGRESDVTRPAGYSTCQPASQYHTRHVFESPSTATPESP